MYTWPDRVTARRMEARSSGPGSVTYTDCGSRTQVSKQQITAMGSFCQAWERGAVSANMQANPLLLLRLLKTVVLHQFTEACLARILEFHRYLTS